MGNKNSWVSWSPTGREGDRTRTRGIVTRLVNQYITEATWVMIWKVRSIARILLQNIMRVIYGVLQVTSWNVASVSRKCYKTLNGMLQVTEAKVARYHFWYCKVLSRMAKLTIQGIIKLWWYILSYPKRYKEWKGIKRRVLRLMADGRVHLYCRFIIITASNRTKNQTGRKTIKNEWETTPEGVSEETHL